MAFWAQYAYVHMYDIVCIHIWTYAWSCIHSCHGEHLFFCRFLRKIFVQTITFAPIWPAIEAQIDSAGCMPICTYVCRNGHFKPGSGLYRRIHTGLSSMKLLELELTGRNLIFNGNFSLYIGKWLKLNSISSWLAIWQDIWLPRSAITLTFESQWAAMKLLRHNWRKETLFPYIETQFDIQRISRLPSPLKI